MGMVLENSPLSAVFKLQACISVSLFSGYTLCKYKKNSAAQISESPILNMSSWSKSLGLGGD